MTVRERTQTGLDFFEFLKETDRLSITNRLQLRDVYNSEFRRRSPGTRDPNFGSVLYALKLSGKITRRRDTIRFNTEVRALYVDQWYKPRTHRAQAALDPETRPALVPETRPALVPTSVSPSEAETGVRARRNLASLLLKRLTKDRTQFISDKNGISITCDRQFDNGKLRLCVEDTYEYTVKLSVKNTGTQPVFFTYYTPLHWLRYLTLTDDHKVTRTNPLRLQPGDCYNIKVQFQCSFVGFYPATLAFEFKPDLPPRSAPFHIVRFIEAHCITALGLELAPVAPYRPRSLPAWTPVVNCTIVDGVRPEGLSVIQLQNVVVLKSYEIPAYMNQLIESLRLSAPDKRKASLEKPLSWQNYAEKFHLLLYLEELQMEVDMRTYNIPNKDKEHAVMFRDTVNKKLLVLEVPGVSENRPSVLRGDHLLVYPTGEAGVKFRGYVHSVELNRVQLGFSSDLLNRFCDGMKFSVEFNVNRLPLRLQHRAAQLAATHALGSVLFPDASSCCAQEPKLPDLRLFDWKLEKNPEQYRAVQNIVAGSSKPAPYLVFGPPGTGKTVTLVEAIKQIEKTQASCHILACAPSNSAADLLCTKILHHVDEHKVYRMYATSRDPRLVDNNLKACSNLVGNCYVFPPKEKLMEFKVIVTTLLTAGRLVTGGIPPGHFTHVLVDEAGHAVETECLVPLAGLLHADTGQVVLAGDPKQLGPILRSPFALTYGLGVSLLERLMNNPLYQKNDGAFNSRFVTKLLCNYRSHPAILHIPNQLFYDNELLCCAEEYRRNSYCSWAHLPQLDFPVIFHSVTGFDERESSSPSFFNRAEVEVLMEYVEKLLQTCGKKGLSAISPIDIGIIAPYRKQVQKIRQALDKVGKKFKFKDFNKLKVGSVEEFQGQERRIIMVSTVRSSSDYTDIDQKFNLGFVRSEKRFNVAVTRAIALLIVVGNPRVLTTDPVWARFIRYCKDGGGYDGVPDSAEEEEDVVTRLAALYISIEAKVETAESETQQQLDPEWRSDL